MNSYGGKDKSEQTIQLHGTVENYLQDELMHQLIGGTFFVAL